jgi:ribosomal protein S18 acetylase RimI-like enzyme
MFSSLIVKLAILMLLYNSFHVTAYYITTPQTQSDYIQLSKLVVNCFESTTTPNGNVTGTMIVETDRWFDRPLSLMKDMKWYIYQRYIIQQQIYQQYIYNANRLYTMKHMILLAKINDDNNRNSDVYYDDSMIQKKMQLKKKFWNRPTVIGMIEFGISMYNVSSSTSVTEATNTTPHHQEQHLRFVIGTICIDPSYRNIGIASQLIHQCESIILQQQWNVTMIYVHVEIHNNIAITLFTKKLGYQFIYTHDNDNKNNNVPQTDMIRVRRRDTIEIVPHYLLCKNIFTLNSQPNDV